MSCDPNTYQFLGFCVEQKINMSVFVSVMLFFLGYIVTKITEFFAKKAIRRKFLVALLQEININIDLLRNSLQHMPDRTKFEMFLKESLPDKHNRPLMTVSYNHVIFKSTPDVLQDLEDILIRNIIQFYGKLDAIKADIGAIENKAFETISLESRNKLFDLIRSQMELGIVEGEKARDGISVYLRLNHR